MAKNMFRGVTMTLTFGQSFLISSSLSQCGHLCQNWRTLHIAFTRMGRKGQPEHMMPLATAVAAGLKVTGLWGHTCEHTRATLGLTMLFCLCCSSIIETWLTGGMPTTTDWTKDRSERRKRGSSGSVEKKGQQRRKVLPVRHAEISGHPGS